METKKQEEKLAYDYVKISKGLNITEKTYYPFDYFTGKMRGKYYWKFEGFYFLFECAIEQNGKRIAKLPSIILLDEYYNKLHNEVYLRYTKNDIVVFDKKINDIKKNRHYLNTGDKILIEVGITPEFIKLIDYPIPTEVKLQLRIYCHFFNEEVE
jgi:hypothetical protein